MQKKSAKGRICSKSLIDKKKKKAGHGGVLRREKKADVYEFQFILASIANSRLTKATLEDLSTNKHFP